MKTIPLALLVFRGGCPVTEAYLSYLQSRGLRPALILAIDYVGESARARQLSRLLGTWLTSRLLRLRRNRAARVQPELAQQVQEGWSVRLTSGREPDYAALADQVIHLTVNDYADPLLLHAMRSCGIRTFLYCSGGRVPASLFCADWRIMHIHPGVVPHVRGSDGLLWSLAVRGRPGASCFFMDAGIDTGTLIATREFDQPRWPGLRVNASELYHALVHCYDPHLRASLLLSVLDGLAPEQDLNGLPAHPQPAGDGHYYTMHAALRERVLSDLCA